MPSLSKLSDAAIAICKAMDELGVDFGIFGGYAVAVLGGPRESKDIDCAVNCSKDWLIEQLAKVDGFRSSGNVRPDFASFLYGDNNILLEFFPTSMSAMSTQRVEVSGEKSGIKATKILDPVFIYKGKLQAAATRAKHSDSADLLYLEGKHNAALRARNKDLNRRHIGMALKRYPHLENSFARLGVDLEACKGAVKDIDVNANPAPPQPNSVQNALLFNLRAT